VELAVLAALALGASAAVRDPSLFRWRTPITLPLAALVGCAIVSAIAAPEFRGNALKFAGRLTAASLLFLLIANVASTGRLARQVIATLLGAAALVGAIAVLELAQLPWVLDALKVFRPGFHVVGGQLRATSTLFYPTITSMFLEIAFALGLVWIAHSRLAFAALALTGAGIVATFTRAGLITMALSLLVYGGIAFYKNGRWTSEHTKLAALAIVIVTLVLMSRSPQMLVTRMSTEGSQDWYGATYDVPATLTLRPDSVNDIPVTVSNRGGLTWQSSEQPVFALSYHWLSVDREEILIYDGARTPFAQPVEPGEERRVNARVRAPGYPGTYLLVWDVVQEHRTWLSLEGVYPGRTIATVEGHAVSAPLPPRGPMPSSVMRMPRRVLWETAAKMAADHPVTGIGPDNFRLTYGRYLGLAAWDTRVHSNNTYLETLAGMGALGMVALVWLIYAAFTSTRDLVARAQGAAVPLVAAATAACLAIAVHGLVDSFLTFTPTYVAFAIATGLLYSPFDPASAGRPADASLRGAR
jgi:hypothetical protein